MPAAAWNKRCRTGRRASFARFHAECCITQATEDKIAELERAAHTVARQEAEVRAWLDVPQGLPPHGGGETASPVANCGDGVARRHTTDTDSEVRCDAYQSCRKVDLPKGCGCWEIIRSARLDSEDCTVFECINLPAA